MTLEDVFEQQNIEEALASFKGKSDRAGLDGVRTSMLGEYWKDNCEDILSMVLSGSYEPGVAEQYEQLNKTGKRRKITVMNAVDRLIARAISQILSNEVDPLLSEKCFGYRKGKSTKDVATIAAQNIEVGNIWVVQMDISSFFDSISHEILFEKLNKVIEDKRIVQLIEQFVACRIETEDGQYRLSRGLIQGLPLSPVLSNIYLMEFDKAVDERFGNYCRYGDDVKIYVSTQKEGQKALQTCRELVEKYGLQVNEKKTGIFMAINQPCLGYEMQQVSGKVLIKPIQHNNKNIYHTWQKSVLKEIDHNYHIVSDGILTKKDFTLLFENDTEKAHLPIEVIDSLSIYSNVIFSSNFFNLMNCEGIIVNVVDKNGSVVGRFIPQSIKRDLRVEMAQIATLNDEKKRLNLAKAFQYANVFNIRATLRYYERRSDCEHISEAVDYISEIMKKINGAKSIDSLMIFEAQARQKYFQCFNDIMTGEGFEFVKRTRRPPEDALNAMLSFGNTLLYTRFSNEIYHSSLDIRFGIVHSSFKRSENLNLDLADLFKPILVDRTIFTLVNRKMINAKQDFEEHPGGGTYLSYRGKKIFIEEFEKKLLQKNTLSDGSKVTYEELMAKEVRKLQDYFKNGKKYKPFKYVN